MKKWILLLVSLLFCLMGCKSLTTYNEDFHKQEISTLLQKQIEDWNKGDMESYVEGYWNSDSLRFASGGNVQYGWQTILEGYKKRYPDKKTIGHLTLSEIDIDIFSDDAALAFGRWTLKQEMDNPAGLFTLLFRKTNQGWRIVSDHTSSASE